MMYGYLHLCIGVNTKTPTAIVRLQYNDSGLAEFDGENILRLYIKNRESKLW